MDSVYSRFHSYDFNNDARFQEGLKTFHSSVSNEELLKLKIFFYNRFIEPVDLVGYREWSALSPMSDHVSKEMSCVKDDCCESGKVTLPQSDLEAEHAQNVQLSFAEVFRMIQAGEEIPGLQKLDIKPCNQLPTVSQMTRKLKPWEK